MSHSAIPSRAAGIIIHENQLLVIYRKKNDSQYYTFPGGTVEDCESTEACALREIVEETSIHSVIKQLVYQVEVHHAHGAKIEYFYTADYISGTPKLQLSSIEASRSSNNNIYRPMWIPLDKLKDIPLYPIEIRNRLIQDLKNGFCTETYFLSLPKNAMQNS
ncbi:NUDIX domain-containing protein [Candidatus Dependentiae bacterium]|nr:NUDIX domain-containing protein [Candidatus Dependentiae bacterium]